ncbi:hypothetical protein ACE1TI_04160 [Alteribacillus sp. JSM 102045]|uniref:hypothetical protein n=1 Tax=Alteribacillus sp. JSM 102045 TaxID=1562101 RepID=UPI0035C2476A
MKPFYIVAAAIILCFAVLGAAGMMLFADNNEKEPAAQKSTEELAAELDRELGVTTSDSSSKEEALNRDNSLEQDSENLLDEDAKKEDNASGQDSNSSSTALALQNETNKITESRAIYIASEEGTISVDELLEIINE